jgi:pimeloyl-ACP methyl ester carboxylesterase
LALETDLDFEQRGSGHPVLFIHGTGTHRDVWQPTAEALDGSFSTTAYDRRGFGRSASGVRTSLSQHVIDAAAILSQLGGDTVVVAQSGAGPIALALAAEHPRRLSHLILAEPAWRVAMVRASAAAAAAQAQLAYRRWIRRDLRAAVLGYYRWATRYTTGGSAWDRLPREWRDLALEDGHIEATLNEIDQLLRPWPSKADVASISTPVTLVTGDLSEPLFRRTTRRVQQALTSSRTEEISGGSHLLFFDRPQPFADLIRGAVEAREARSR